MAVLSLSSPVGPLAVEEIDGEIIRLGWQKEADEMVTPLLRHAVEQLDAYFAGDLTEFDLPLAPQGTDFQRRVWAAMAEIPYGETWSYGGLAARAKTVARAVGGACGANPIPIILPCHRVVGANGAAGGFSGRGGVQTKGILLDIENRKTRLL